MLYINSFAHTVCPSREEEHKNKLQPQRKVTPNTGMGVEVVNHQPRTKESFLSVWRFFPSVYCRRKVLEFCVLFFKNFKNPLNARNKRLSKKTKVIRKIFF